jgi:peroxiredoxin Q/BCP
MLKHSWILALAMFAVSGFCADVAKVGEPLPQVNATDENGALLNLNQFKDKMGLVIFFYPKAFTGGCVCENAGFRDYSAKYLEKGYMVLGASRDDNRIQKIFKDKYHLNYTLLSDPNDELARTFGVTPGKRDTVVIGKDGRVMKILHDVDAPTHHKTLINEL